MWNNQRKLQKWVEVGLISDTQGHAIRAYEAAHKKGRFGRGLIGLAIFSILVGILAIIASNWHVIPGNVKIGAHVLLNLIVGIGAYWGMKNHKDLWREGFSLAFFGLTLTLIALIGQVMQLKGDTAGALLLWMIASLPFMLIFSRSSMTAFPWVIALYATVGFVAAEYVQGFPKHWETVFYYGLSFLMPLTIFGIGTLSFIKRLKPAWADACVKIGMVTLVLGVSLLVTIFGYSTPHDLEILEHRFLPLIPVAIGLMGIFLHTTAHHFYKGDNHAYAGALFATASVIAAALPVLLLGGHGALVASVLFIGYWAFLGKLAQTQGYMWVVSLSIFLIAVRIFVIYLELFGTLFDTGLALITGGVVILGLIYIARKTNARLTKNIGDEA